jgi:hypothetical protein
MKRQNALSLCYLGVAIAALMLLASSLSRLAFLPGQSFPLWDAILGLFRPGTAQPIGAGAGGALQSLIAIVFWAILAVTAVALVVSRELRRLFLRRMLVSAVAVFLILLLIRALRANPALPEPELAPRTPGAGPDALGAPGLAVPAFVTNPPQWLILAITAVLAALLAGAIWLLWRRARPQPTAIELLAREAEAALADLDAGGDLAETVLRCYGEMIRVLREQRGLERQKTMTPREFEQYLAAAGLRDGHIRQLTRLFESARYGGGRASARDQREAVACLTAIVETYGRSP